MKPAVIAVIAATLSVSQPAVADKEPAPRAPEAPIGVTPLIGEWNVTLFFSPDAPPSETTLVISNVEEGVLTGTFYDSPFLDGRALARDGEVRFTVLTEDGSGQYATAGRLVGETITGTSLSVGRGFIMAWDASRAGDSNDND
ncbi:MAG: hypothetical protein AAFR41_10435 [Pseudomonadota bacterium]